MIEGTMEGLITGFIGGTIAQSLWSLVRFRRGRTFSFQDFLLGMRIGGAKEEDYQHELNKKRLTELEKFCEETRQEGRLEVHALYRKIGELFKDV